MAKKTVATLMLPRFSIFSQFFSPVLCDEQATKKTAANARLITAKNPFFIVEFRTSFAATMQVEQFDEFIH